MEPEIHVSAFAFGQPLQPNLSPISLFEHRICLVSSPSRVRKRCAVPPWSRMRNPGGFSTPPRIPMADAERQRAIELLGNYTQRRRMHLSRKQELESLVGQLPASKELSQQWKASLQRLQDAPRRIAHRQDPTAFSQRDALVQQLPLPRDLRKLSRMFILLEVVRKRHNVGGMVKPHIITEITSILGSCPTSAQSARRYIRALAYMQRLRRRAERFPPCLPLEDLEALHTAHMLLGIYANAGSVGAQTSVLLSLIGATPPTKTTALSWKKIVAAVIRKKKRKDRVHAKRFVDNQKRLQRRLKRLKKEEQIKSALQTQNGDLAPFLHEHYKTTSTPQDIAPSSTTQKENGSGPEPHYLMRLTSALARLFT